MPYQNGQPDNAGNHPPGHPRGRPVAAPSAPSGPPRRHGRTAEVGAAAVPVTVPATVWAPPAYAVGPGWGEWVRDRVRRSFLPPGGCWWDMTAALTDPTLQAPCPAPPPFWAALIDAPTAPRCTRRRPHGRGDRDRRRSRLPRVHAPEPTPDAAAAPDGAPSVGRSRAGRSHRHRGRARSTDGWACSPPGCCAAAGSWPCSPAPPHRRRRPGGRDRRDRRVGPERGPALPATHRHPGPAPPAGPRDRVPQSTRPLTCRRCTRLRMSTCWCSPGPAPATPTPSRAWPRRAT